MKPTDPFSARLREARTARRMTQQQVAERLGLSAVSYGAWERGDAEPSIASLVRLCGIFEVSADWLVGLSSEPAPTDATERVAEDAETAAVALKRLLASIDRLSRA